MEEAGWISRSSKSRPDAFYFYNKRTGKSQWERPTKESDADKVGYRMEHIEKIILRS